MSFGDAAQRYLDSKPNLCDRDAILVSRVCALLGDKPVSEIIQDDVYRVVNAVYGDKAKPSTKNRCIITPASAVLNYAAANEWRNLIKLKRYKEPTPAPRYVTVGVEKQLMKAVKGDKDKTLLLLWLFRQGDRISDALSIKYEAIDLKKKVVNRYISKSDRYAVLPVDDAICAVLKKRGKKEGFVFPWRTRFGAERWILRLSRGLGVHFSPHMARHTLGKRLSDAGVGLKPIMDILGQTDPRAGIRYQNTGIEELRAAKNKSIVGRKVGEGKNVK